MKFASLDLIQVFSKISVNAPTAPVEKTHLNKARKVLGRAPKFVVPSATTLPSDIQERVLYDAKFTPLAGAVMPYDEVVVEHEFLGWNGCKGPVVTVLWKKPDGAYTGISFGNFLRDGGTHRWGYIPGLLLFREGDNFSGFYTELKDDEEQAQSAMRAATRGVHLLGLYLSMPDDILEIDKPFIPATYKGQAKKQKATLDYHVLTLRPGGLRAAAERSAFEGSRGIMPEHERRKHTRRLRDGRVVEVRATTVNKGKERKVKKDYVIKH